MGLPPLHPCFFVTPDSGVTARLRGLSDFATAFVASQHAYNLFHKLLTSRSRPKDAYASALWKPAQKLFKKVLSKLSVRIQRLSAVARLWSACFSATLRRKNPKSVVAPADSRWSGGLRITKNNKNPKKKTIKSH